MKNQYFDLLKLWCDRLLDFQIKEMNDPRLDGGLLCPACAHIHGRCADAIYPLLTVAEHTGDEKYIRAAKALYRWTDANFKLPYGGYLNDRSTFWHCTTAFYQTALCEALLHHGHLLDEETVAEWKKAIEEATDFLIRSLDAVGPVVNYYAARTACAALAGKVLGREDYLEKAREFAQSIYQYIDEDFLIGEAHPLDARSPKGCRAIDIGYNMEESLGALAMYVNSTGDSEMKQRLIPMLKQHLNFLLPDGAIDDSFGVRSAKWTYYGSRTSDGCQIAYGLMADEDPAFAEAAHRNFELQKKCTVDGLLAGGPMHGDAGEPACLHHTFCHAKALAFLVDSGFERPENALLPSERGDAVNHYRALDVWQIRKGPWQATISGYDLPGQCSSGGAMTLLWHEKSGPILAASLPKYLLVEPLNMQISRTSRGLCQTPHIAYNGGAPLGTTQFYDDEARFSSLYDRSAQVTRTGENTFSVQGVLRSASGETAAPFALTYAITENAVTITVRCDEDGASFRIPLIASSREQICLTENTLEVTGAAAVKQLRADVPLHPVFSLQERNFNPTGGFQTFIVSADLAAGEIASFSISVD